MRKLLILPVLLFVYFFSHATEYYVSSSGNDANPGTITAPWKTLAKVNSFYFKPKDFIYFKRGNTFYGKLSLKIPGTTLGIITIDAYGTGPKPVISLYATVKPTAWMQYNSSTWRVAVNDESKFTGSTKTGGDIGFLKVNGKIYGGKKKSLSECVSPYDFYVGSTYLYVRTSTNPSTKNIMVSTHYSGVYMSNYSTVKNLKVTGAGNIGVGGRHTKNFKLINVDVEEIGGCYLDGLNAGYNRYGNGIQFFNGATDCLVDSCTVKYVYDVALTMQTAHSTSPAEPFTNVIIQNCLVDSCEQAWEGTHLELINGAPNPVAGFKGCRIRKNVFKNCGYGWSHLVRPRQRGIVLLSYQWYISSHDLEDLIIENNTFYRAANGLYYAQNGGDLQQIPNFTSRNNTIILDDNTLLRANYPSQTVYNWKIADKDIFTGITGKESGSVVKSTSSTTTFSPSFTNEQLATDPLTAYITMNAKIAKQEQRKSTL